MKTSVTKEAQEFRKHCSCGCGAAVLVQIADFDEIMIDTRLMVAIDGRVSF